MLNKRLLKESSIKKLYIPVIIINAIINSIFIIVTAALLDLIVEGVFLKKCNLNKINLYILLFLLNASFRFVSNFFIQKYIKDFSEDIKNKIKLEFFNLILSINPYKIKNNSTGELVNILTDGMEMITPYYSQYIPQVATAVFTSLMICTAVAFVDRLSALIMVITFPIIPIFMALIGYKTKELNEKQWKKLNILSSHFLDMLQGLNTLKSFGRSKIQEEKIYEVSESYRKSTMEVLKVTFLSALVLELSATISTAVVAVDLGLRLVYSKISFLQAFFILVLTPDFYMPLRQLGMRFHSSLNAQVVIQKIEDMEKELKSEEYNYSTFDVQASRKKECSKKKSDVKIDINRGLNIEVKDLRFSHEFKDNLNNISFTINAGEKVALVGESGCGKSTLINILSGFLKVDDDMVYINGIDLNSINKDSYFSKVAIVPQFPHIFNMDIENNILMGNKMNNSDILNIYQATKVDLFSDEFKDKYKTIIGEGEEIEVSGGERQRIALARAVVKNADFIILDEATSALDSKTEEIIIDIMKDYFGNKTVLISAHRLNTIKAVDKILVLQDGYLVEIGNHEELMKRRGRYYNMMK